MPITFSSSHVRDVLRFPWMYHQNTSVRRFRWTFHMDVNILQTDNHFYKSVTVPWSHSTQNLERQQTFNSAVIDLHEDVTSQTKLLQLPQEVHPMLSFRQTGRGVDPSFNRSHWRWACRGIFETVNALTECSAREAQTSPKCLTTSENPPCSQQIEQLVCCCWMLHSQNLLCSQPSIEHSNAGCDLNTSRTLFHRTLYNRRTQCVLNMFGTF